MWIVVWGASMSMLPQPTRAMDYPDDKDWIVRFDVPELAAAHVTQIRDLLKAAIGQGVDLQAVHLPATLRLQLPKNLTVQQLKKVLESALPVRFLEPNRRWRPALLPNDEEFANGNQWGLRNVGKTLLAPADVADGYATECDSQPNDDFEFCDRDPGVAGIDAAGYLAWDISTGSSGAGKVRIAVIDSGLDIAHPDFQIAGGSKIWRHSGEFSGTPFASADYGWDACDKDGMPEDLVGHGTQVAAVIAAEGNNGIGIAGVIWDAEIVPIKFLDVTRVADQSDCNLTTAALEALEFARLVKADVVNLSWGGPDESQALADKLKELAAHGIVLVAASGNDGVSIKETPFYPASYELPQMFSVAAHTNNGNLASFSNFGGTVNIAAPGASIRTHDAPMVDLWGGANFSDFNGEVLEAGTAVPLEGGGISGTNFSVSGNANWGIGKNILGDVIMLADIDAAIAGTAHGAAIDATLAAEGIDAAAWGGALLQYTLFHDLGPGASLTLEYRDGLGLWTSVPEATYTEQGANLFRLNFATLFTPLPTDLQVRFRLKTVAAYDGAGGEDTVVGGIQILDIGWLKPGTNYDDAIVFSQGTSLAAPFVAGAAALVKTEFPNWRASDIVQQVLFRAAQLPKVNNGVEGNRMLHIAAALSPEPLLVWTAEPGFENDGVEPNAAVTGDTVRFAARLLDRDGIVPLGAAAAFEIKNPDSSIFQLAANVDTNSDLFVEAVFENEGTYGYRTVVVGAAGEIAGEPATYHTFTVGNPEAGIAPENLLPDIAESNRKGCGCRTAPVGRWQHALVVLILAVPLVVNRYWRVRG